MPKFELFKQFNDKEVDWLLSCAESRQLVKGSSLVTDGEPLEYLILLTGGLLNILRPRAEGHEVVATVGAGEIIGETTIVDNYPSTVRIQAEEDSQVLLVPKKEVQRKLREDLQFAADFYRSIAIRSAQRLRHALHDRDRWDEQRDHSGLFDLITELKMVVSALEEATLNEEPRAEMLKEELTEMFNRILNQAQRVLGTEGSPIDGRRRDGLGSRLKEELYPFISLTGWTKRAVQQQRGYPGDGETLADLYDRKIAGRGTIGPLMDRCFMGMAAFQSLVERKNAVGEEILRLHREVGHVEIACLTPGAAPELFDLFKKHPKGVHASILGFDGKALAQSAELAAERKLSDFVRIHDRNLNHIALGKEKWDGPPLDLVYSLGFLDYLEDRWAVRLLSQIHDRLKPGGEVVLGNFHPANPSRAVMEYVLGWKVLHRSEADIARLFKSSAFGSEPSRCGLDEAGATVWTVHRKGA